MKILFYISTIRGGGAGRVMVNLANQFYDARDTVWFVTNFPAEVEYEINPEIKRVSLESTENHNGFVKKNLKRIIELRKYIKLFHPDIVISFMHENDTRAFFATLGLKCKLILSVRNNPDDLYKSNIKKRVAKFVYGHADGVVFQTQEAKDWFGGHVKNAKIIFNQVADEFYKITRNEKNCQDIIALGSFTKQKNHLLLMQAYILISDLIDDNLIIYGDGELRPLYEKFILDNHMQSRILLPGNITDVSVELAKSKLFVLSSNYEGMPNALMEAMAVGLPCISTDCPCGGPRELKGESNSIDLINMNDVKQLAERMLYILEDKKYADSISENARMRAEEFKPDRTFKQWKSFIKNICQ